MKLRKALKPELPVIWEIIQQAIEQRRAEGSEQWQDGYPNEAVISNDIDNGYAYVLEDKNRVRAYAAVIFDEEPAYEAIQGQWLSQGLYAVVHRVAVSGSVKGKGMATLLFTMIEELCREQQVPSIKVDTNFDNRPMLRILDKLGYTYCGEVFFRGSPRRAYEKLLA